MRWFLLFAAAVIPGFAEVRVTYLANEGVMLTAGSAKVLVDALFRDSLGDYARHPAGVQQAIETGQPPFDGVGLALATHFHLDHWDAGAISRFLVSNSRAEFGSTPGATGMLPSAVRDRVRVLWPGEGARGVERAGVKVEAFPLTHGRTQNLAYRIEMGGRVLVHLGDAETVKANFDRLAEGPAPDVLLAPFWWLLDPGAREFLRDRWKPKAVVALHFGSEDARVSAEKVGAAWPGVWVATKASESRIY